MTFTEHQPPPRTTDPRNTALSLQFLRLYASPSTAISLYFLRAADHPLPTFAAFVQASRTVRN